MEFRKTLQLRARIRDLLQLFVGNAQEQREGVFKRRHQDLLFAFEVEIDRAVGYVGLARDIRDTGIEVSVLGEDVYGGLQDAVALFRAGALGMASTGVRRGTSAARGLWDGGAWTQVVGEPG